MRRAPARRLAALATALLAACRVGPDYHAPEPKAPDAFGELAGAGEAVPSVATAEAPLERWWSEFHDATLDSLVGRALAANPDLWAAQARVREARALRGVAAADFYPQVDASASATRQSFSANSRNAGPVAGFTTNLFQAGFDASWELDLFGRTRRSVEAAEAEVAASIEDQRGVQVSLLAEVARAYVELRGAQRQSAIAQANLAAQQETLDLTRTRSEAGLASELDVARAEAQVRTTAARLPVFQTTERSSMHLLAVLLAREPDALAAELAPVAPIPAAPAQVPVGLPSELLRRRPDVRRAEQELAAATARIGVATADLFPRISLTAALGLASANADELFDFNSRSWSTGAGAFLPLLDFGRLRRVIDVADAREEQAAAAYEAAVLTSLREVADALVSFAREQVRQRELAAATEANRRAVTLADQVYREGETDFLAVLEAQRDLYASEDAQAESAQRVASELVALYKALGGGWESAPDVPEGATAPERGTAGNRVLDLQGTR